MQNTQPNQAPAGAVDIQPIVARVREGLPPQLQGIYDKAVLSGMRIMFDKDSHQMTLDALNKPGPLATRISNGIIQLMYLLWQQSNQTLPPQIMVPVTVTLTVKAFDFLQQVQDPEATPAVLGEATADAVQGLMDRFGATQDKLPELLKAQGAGQSPPPGATAAAPPQGRGMLDSVGGQ